MSNCLHFMVKCKDEKMSALPEHIRFLLQELSGSTLIEKSQVLWVKLQSLVDNILDADINPSSRVSTRGVKQVCCLCFVFLFSHIAFIYLTFWLRKQAVIISAIHYLYHLYCCSCSFPLINFLIIIFVLLSNARINFELKLVFQFIE